MTYQNDRLCERVQKLGAEVNCDIFMPCDLGHDEQIGAVFDTLGQHWDSLEIIVHSAAFAPREELEGDYVDNVTREGFKRAHDVSAYSFAALAKAGRWMLRDLSLIHI